MSSHVFDALWENIYSVREKEKLMDALSRTATEVIENVLVPEVVAFESLTVIQLLPQICNFYTFFTFSKFSYPSKKEKQFYLSGSF